MTFIVEFLSHKIALVLIFAFLIVPISFIYGIAKKKPIYNALVLVLFGLVMFNLFAGSRFTNGIINKNGELGMAIITGTEGTGNYYNNVESIRYDVLLKTKEGETVETSFESADNNVYPTPEEEIDYPEAGVEFSVKYLPDAPEHFIILLNEDNAFTQELECDNLKTQIKTAEAKMNFDQTNESFKEDFEQLQQAYLDEGCSPIENNQDISQDSALAN